jgi:enediyne biosynthesis protein E4
MQQSIFFGIWTVLWTSGCKQKNLECVVGDAYTDSESSFVEKTDSWGLTDINATGTRISAVDYDGDGWTDLFIRKNDSGDDFDTDERNSWLLRNTGQGTFEDATESSGIRQARSLDTGRPGQVVAFADVDNDGDLDVYTGHNFSGNSVETSELLLNNGDGTFSLGSEDNAVRENTVAQTAGASFVDVDRDGYVDLWLGQASAEQDRLLLNTGDGTASFSDVTNDWGLQTQSWTSIGSLNQALGHSVSWSVHACDLNNDGSPELLAASYGRAPNHLWMSDGVTYANQSIESGYAFDQNQDWTDNESARCWCALHPTDDECAGVPEPSLIRCDSDEDAFRWSHSQDRNAFRLGGNSGTTICADIDNDGWMDLLTTEIVHWDVGGSSDASELLLNQQDSEVRFARPGNQNTGLTREHTLTDWNDGDITAAVLDFDNDGWKDVYIGSTDYPDTRGLLYRQISKGQFEPVPLDVGIDHPRSHGVAIADFDGDGDLDMVIGHSSGRCDDDCPESFHARFYENQMQEAQIGGAYIQLDLVGADGSNRSAIGARVEIETEAGLQVQEVGGGFGHYGAQNDLRVHFGLGEACEATVRVRWPDAELTETEYTLTGNQRYTIVQGEDPDAP